MQAEKESRMALHNSIWELLFKYTGLRDELSGLLLSFQLMHEEMRNAMEEIEDEMEELEKHLEICGSELQGFHAAGGVWDPLDAICKMDSCEPVLSDNAIVFESSATCGEPNEELPFD